MAPANLSAMSLKRIRREVADVQKEDLGAIVLAPSDNLYHWKGSIPGPQGSPYEGGTFHVDVHLAADYPFSAPKVIFSTRIYHMNISDKGNICIDILKNNWSPALSLFKVMLSLSSLLTDPNPQDPLVPSIANEFIRNRQQHDSAARQWTRLYACPQPLPSALAPSSTPSSSSARPSPSARTRLQGKATEMSSSSDPQISTSTIQQHVETITIEDSDDDLAISSSRLPMRSCRRRRKKGDVVDLDLTADVESSDTSIDRPNKRLRMGSESVKGTNGPTRGDVIVID